MKKERINEIAQEYREKIKLEAFYKTDTGHGLNLTKTRELLLEALTKAHQAGIDKAVEIVEKKRKKFENDELAILAGMQDIKVNAANEIIEALQDNK